MTKYQAIAVAKKWAKNEPGVAHFVVRDWEDGTFRAMDEDALDFQISTGDVKESEIEWCSDE